LKNSKNSTQVRTLAASALKKIGLARNSSAIDKAWAAAYCKDWKIVEKLGTEAMEPLLSIIQEVTPNNSSYHDRGRGPAADVLAKIGTPALEPLIKILQTSPGQDLIVVTAKVLGNIKDKRAVEPLIKELEKQSNFRYIDRKCIETIIIALGQIGDKRAAELIIDIFEKLVSGKNERSEYLSVIKVAAKVLGKIVNERAIEPLILTLTLPKPKFPHQDARIEAVKSLVKIGEPAVDLLINAVDHDQLEVRVRAARALGQIEDSRAMQPLINLLKDPSYKVREAATIAVQKIGGDRVIDLLIDSLKDSEASVRTAAVKSLTRIGELSVAPLIETLHHDNYKVREAAARALGQIGDKQVVEYLIVMLKDESHEVRRTTAKALGLIGDLRAVDSLNLALEDIKPGVRKAAAEGLRLIEDRKT